MKNAIFRKLHIINTKIVKNWKYGYSSTAFGK